MDICEAKDNRITIYDNAYEVKLDFEPATLYEKRLANLLANSMKSYRCDKCGKLWRVVDLPKTIPGIKKVIFNPPATIVMWDDGTKTIVKAKGGKKNERDEFSEEYGLAMAIAKRYFGSRSAFLKTVNDAKRPEAKE